MYLSFVTGRRPAEVFARFENAGAPVDVFDSLSIRLDDGALVSLATHGAPMPSERQFESPFTARAACCSWSCTRERWKFTTSGAA